jgi:hypothetical protein
MARQSDPIVKVRVALMANMYRSLQETDSESVQAYKGKRVMNSIG